jgi:FixJ family two-component response regulator
MWIPDLYLTKIDETMTLSSKILLLEGGNTDITEVEEALEASAYDVFRVIPASSDEFLQTVLIYQPSLIVCDVAQASVVEWIKKESGLDLPVVFLALDNAIRVPTNIEGKVAFLTAPYSNKILFSTIELALA